MIKENQRLLNHINLATDILILFLSFPIGFWIRFAFFPGIITIGLSTYTAMGAVYTAIQLFVFAALGMYQSYRQTPLRVELQRLFESVALVVALLLGTLYVGWGVHFSRGALAIIFAMILGLLSVKRFLLRRALRFARQKGYNQKHIVLVGNGHLAAKYLNEIRKDAELGYTVIGYVSLKEDKTKNGLTWLGSFEQLEDVLEGHHPDEVISAVELKDFGRTPGIIEACESAGIKLSIIPFYADYMPSNPQFDTLNGIPLLNIRRIPLDNYANAFLKRTMDIVGSVILLVVTSPIMLFCAIGVKLSSPGPVIFKQQRVGRNKQLFYIYKFRSMRINDSEDTAWSTNEDSRRTKFGTFMRKLSLDEFPQFWNVLKGDMSLVGPRPEIPHYVDQFKKEVPLYMVKHQVRPGITGWAQIHGFRGDTSIQGRIEHDIYYIENWSIWLDIQILFSTVFKGKFVNDER